ncbi:hypothetical protein FGADI_11757 [Fusarium gaditjirri]|uniref:2EXR domain-containing protein n=1 Tax=Fusarium gaditjirri TaxID=282569 RepID=A0A8H4WPZ7_9HYPO|nr:hypothetical protein FGADI_11757 [Fusarium gaditjirri]
MAVVPYTKQQLDDCILMPHGPSTSEFHVFGKLPYDLRHKVWELALSNYRHIKVFLADVNDWEFSIGPYHHRKVLLVNEDDSDKPYEIFVMAGATFHPLLNTTLESRNVAKLFYRVQLPCRRMGRDGSVRGTLFLCPELDTVQVDTSCSLLHFEKFADAVFSADRNNIGLVNLALDTGFRHSHGLIPLDSSVRTRFMDAVRRIEILVMVGQAAKPKLLMYGSNLRVINSYSEFIATNTYTEEYDLGSFNHKSGLHDNELKAVHIGDDDPRHGYYCFCLLMQEIGVPEDVYKSSLCHELFMLTHSEVHEFIPTNGDTPELMPANNNAQEEEDNHGPPPPAIGFWLFPLSRVGPFVFEYGLNPRTGLPPADHEGKMVQDRVLDLSECHSRFCFYHPTY